MAGGVEREDVYKAAELVEWVIDETPTRNGYTKFKCPASCGVHQMWLHKTPSNPNHFREKRQWLLRQTCSVEVLKRKKKEMEARRSKRR